MRRPAKTIELSATPDTWMDGVPGAPPKEELTEWEAQEIRCAFDNALTHLDDAIERLVSLREDTLSGKGHGHTACNDAQRVAQAYFDVGRLFALINAAHHRAFMVEKERERLTLASCGCL
jgi:hypothetical protein